MADIKHTTTKKVGKIFQIFGFMLISKYLSMYQKGAYVVEQCVSACVYTSVCAWSGIQMVPLDEAALFSSVLNM